LQGGHCFFGVLPSNENLPCEPSENKKEGIILQFPFSDKPCPGKTQCENGKEVERRAVVGNVDGGNRECILVMFNGEPNTENKKHGVSKKRRNMFDYKVCKPTQGDDKKEEDKWRDENQQQKKYHHRQGCSQ